MERKYETGLRNLAITAATGLVLLVGGAGMSGCNHLSRDVDRTEKPYEESSHTDKYFRNAYNSITLDKLTEEEREIIKKADIKDMPKEQRDFVGKHFMYVNLKQPTSKDLAFLMHYEELINIYKDYKSIDVKNLSPEEKNTIKEFREEYLIKENSSWKINLNKLTQDEKEFLKSVEIFVDPNKVLDRDIIFIDNIVSGFAAIMMH